MPLRDSPPEPDRVSLRSRMARWVLWQLPFTIWAGIVFGTESGDRLRAEVPYVMEIALVGYVAAIVSAWIALVLTRPVTSGS